MRYSLLTLLLAVTIVAIGCMALLNASSPWASVFFAGAFCAWPVSVLAAIWCRDGARARGSGFAIAAGAYFLLVYGPGFSETVRPGLPTTAALNSLYPKVRKEVLSSTVNQIPDGTPVAMRAGQTYVAVPHEADFMRIGHSMCALICGGLGALIGDYLQRTSRFNQKHPG